MIIKLFTYACIVWTAYLVMGFVYGFLKAMWRDLKNSGHV